MPDLQFYAFLGEQLAYVASSISKAHFQTFNVFPAVLAAAAAPDVQGLRAQRSLVEEDTTGFAVHFHSCSASCSLQDAVRNAGGDALRYAAEALQSGPLGMHPAVTCQEFGDDPEMVLLVHQLPSHMQYRWCKIIPEQGDKAQERKTVVIFSTRQRS